MCSIEADAAELTASCCAHQRKISLCCWMGYGRSACSTAEFVTGDLLWLRFTLMAFHITSIATGFFAMQIIAWQRSWFETMLPSHKTHMLDLTRRWIHMTNESWTWATVFEFVETKQIKTMQKVCLASLWTCIYMKKNLSVLQRIKSTQNLKRRESILT